MLRRVRPQDELAFVSSGDSRPPSKIFARRRSPGSAGRASRQAVSPRALFGASIVEQYAAWDFARNRRMLSWLAVLADGRSGNRKKRQAAVWAKDDYVNGVTVGSFGRVGLSQNPTKRSLFCAAAPPGVMSIQ